MKKTDKKINAAIIKQLNWLCDELKFTQSGFCHLTHELSATAKPVIVISLYFEDEMTKEAAQLNHQAQVISLVENTLKPLGLSFNQPNQQVCWCVK